MAALQELAGQVAGEALWSEPLARHTTLGIGGAAELLVIPHDAADLVRSLELCETRGVPWRVLGNGSNLLVNDRGVAGVVFKLRGTLEGLGFEAAEGGPVRVVAGAGLMLPRLVEEAAERDLSGLEPLAGIPGSLGGALAMNAGAHGHSIGELVEWVTFWERGAGVCTLGREELAFAYRDSLLRRGGRVALEAELTLTPCEPGLAARRVREALARRKARQPLGLRSAGSVFRNPEGGYAGALIEAAGLKGARVGEAEVSSLHANFIVNRGRATASEVKALMELARQRVKETSGIELRPEVVLWEE